MFLNFPRLLLILTFTLTGLFVSPPELIYAFSPPGNDTLCDIFNPPRKLVIDGGAGQTSNARKKFVELAGGTSARIVAIPTAYGSYFNVSLLSQYNPASVKVFHTTDKAQANDPNFVKPITEATGVWFEGGDQLNITDAYLGTLVEEELWKVLERGGAIGGTSAGAAIMSRVMIAYAKEYTGFGFLPGVIVDQHFLVRNRQSRLLNILRNHPDLVGVGIDEPTFLVINGTKATVMGKSQINIYFTGNQSQPDKILYPSDTFNFFQLKDSNHACPSVTPTPPSFKQLITFWLTSLADQNGDSKVNAIDFTQLAASK